MTWGLLTGTFFGQAFAAKAGLRPLLPRLNEPKFMQAFCFFLGALHLSVGHCWRAFLKIPSLAALADIGWIGVLWAAFFFAKTLILGEALPFFVTRLLFCGMALVVLFTSPQRNILKGIASGLGTLALSLMNNFTDVVSYVRLFAVGMAGLAIAETANSIAVGAGGNSALGVLATGAILVVGHGLNLLLGPMSVLVHGVRLNVLEFSSHAGISWSGEPYQPLKE
jgi:V/A-type H+-transporting ATPase subunit I